MLCCGLTACGGEQYSDLRQFVKDSEKLPHGRIPPLPDVKPYEPFTYDAYDLIDPFKPRKIEPPKTAAAAESSPIWRAAKSRSRPTRSRICAWSARCSKTSKPTRSSRAPTTTVPGQIGELPGTKLGLITVISESTIKLKEIVQDSGGDWTERVSTLTLAEEAGK